MSSRSSKSVFGQTRTHLHTLLLASVGVATGVWLSAMSALVQAQPAQAPSANLAKPANSPASAANALVLATSFGSPTWGTLTPAQQAALKPLASSWAGLSDAQKRKWISLSANFPQLPPAEQTKMHARMVQWAALSPREREQARLNFGETKQVDPQKKSEQWQAYQALSTEEKQKLAKTAQAQPPRTALAAQPSASDKINRVPLKKGLEGAGLPSTNSNTLLPRPTPPVPPTPPASIMIIDGIAPQ